MVVTVEAGRALESHLEVGRKAGLAYLHGPVVGCRPLWEEIVMLGVAG